METRKLQAALHLLALLKAIGKAALVLLLIVGSVQAEPCKSHKSHKSRNYILRRQEAYQVQGVPTSRIIIGKRQIDVYPNGLMFEGDNVVGVKGR